MRDIVMTTTTLTYDYESRGGSPPVGQALENPTPSPTIAFSYTDYNAVDQTAFLQSIVVDDQITVNGVVWTITAVQQQTNNAIFTRDPNISALPYGVTNFEFSQSGGVGNLISVTVTDANEGTTIATNGLLFSIQFVSVQTGDYHGIFSLVDDSAGEINLFTMRPAMQYISPGAIYQMNGHSFGNLTVKNIPKGSSFTIEYSAQGV
jgi:hypothetical protein